MELPRLEPEIVNYLREKLPPLEYQENQMINAEEFLSQSAYRAGQRNIIMRLEKIVKDQNK